MARRFNTVGVCHPEQHYVLDAQERLPQVKALVAQPGCFWVYGPCQTGKSTTMRLWAMSLTKRGKYAALVVSAASLALTESGNGGDSGAIAEEAFLYELREAAYRLPEDCQPPEWGYQLAGQQIRAALTAWAEACPRPLLLFIDDMDALKEPLLLSLLRQLESGFNQHRPFPQSMALIGLQDINHRAVNGPLPTSAQCFHRMRTATLAVQNFTLEEVANVYQTHTDVTGQLFTLEAVDRAFELTYGQPWLVNAIAQQAIEQTQAPIEPRHIDDAAESLIHAQFQAQTVPVHHITSRLSQFQSLLEPILADQVLPASSNHQILDLVASGLCRWETSGGLAIANSLYQRVLLQQLALPAIASLGSLQSQWLNLDGTIDVHQVWHSFAQVWQAQGDDLIQAVPYRAIAPYMAVMAFFHRLVFPQGHLTPMYGFNQQFMQLSLRVKAPSQSLAMRVHVIVWSDGPDPTEHGINQLQTWIAELPGDAANTAVSPVALILLDQRSDRPPAHERTHLDSVAISPGQTIPLIRG